jgi:hypothetical protein
MTNFYNQPGIDIPGNVFALIVKSDLFGPKGFKIVPAIAILPLTVFFGQG